MDILLDTNAYTMLFAGNLKVQQAIKEADNVLMSVIVIGELAAGFKGGKKESMNVEMLQDFLNSPNVQTININIKTAFLFGGIKNQLKKQGTPIPLNDVWIAAQNLEYDCHLLTFDKHFEYIPGIQLYGGQKFIC